MSCQLQNDQICQSGSSVGEDPEKGEKVSSLKPLIGQYLLGCIQLGYFSFLVPFLPRHDRKTKTYVLHSNWIQQILTFCVWGSALLSRITILRRCWQNHIDSSHSPILYFNLAHSTFHLILYVALFRTLLKGSSQIILLFNKIKDSCLLFNTQSGRNTKTRIYVFTTQFIWTTLQISAPILGYEIINSKEWTFTNFVNAHILNGRYTFFLHTNSSKLQEPDKLDGFLAFLHFVGNASHCATLFFMCALFGNCAIILWSAVSGFKELVLQVFNEGDKQSSQGSPSQIDLEQQLQQQSSGKIIISAFTELEELSYLINTTFHLVFFLYIFDISVWLSTELDRGLRSDDWFLKIHMLHYLVYLGVTLILSGETYRKFEWVRIYVKSKTIKLDLSENRSAQSSNATIWELTQIFKLIKYPNIGIGNAGFYMLNYSFIGQILGLIVTFFIISVQFEVNKGYVLDTKNSTLLQYSFP